MFSDVVVVAVTMLQMFIKVPTYTNECNFYVPLSFFISSSSVVAVNSNLSSSS